MDIGGQSTKPGAQLISNEEELSRIIPVIKAFRSKNTDIFILFYIIIHSISFSFTFATNANICRHFEQ